MMNFFQFTSTVKILYLGGYIALLVLTLPEYLVSKFFYLNMPNNVIGAEAMRVPEFFLNSKINENQM